MRATSRMLAALAGAAALAAMPAAAGAAPGWTGATPVPDSPAAPYPVVGYDADGAATALWQESINPTGIKVASKQPGGAWSRSAYLLGGQSQGRPALAFADDGSAVAAWWSDGTATVDVVSRDVDGEWSDIDSISAGDGVPTSPPSLTIDRNGNVTVAWGQTCEAVTSTRPVRSSRWSEPLPIFPAPAGCGSGTPDYGTIVSPPAIGADRNGNVTVVWRTGNNSPITVKGLKSAVRTGGVRGSWSAPKPIAVPAGRAPAGSEPDLVVDVDGRAVVAWPVENAGAAVTTRPAGVDAAWDVPQSLTSTRTSYPSVALDAHGRASIAWDAAQDGATLGTVKLSTVTPAGIWSGPETVATLPDGSDPAFSPELTLDDDGGASVVWSRAGGTRVPIESARRPAGGAWSAIQTLAADAPPRTIVGLAGDQLGNTTTVWPVAPDAVADPGSDTSAITGLASADHNAEPALRTDWTGRTDPTTNSLRSWVNYLYSFGAGDGFVELTDGATWPDPADRYSWRWGQADAWRDVTNGELVIEQQGTLRFAMPSHFIDIRLIDPTLRVAADGASARLISDGLAGGSMEDARAGRTELTPFEDVHVLDVDLRRGGYRAGEAVGRRSWIAAPATVTPEGSRLGLTYLGAPFGTLTFSAPTSVPDRDPPRPPVDPPRPPVDPPRPPVDPPRPPVDPPRPPVEPVARRPLLSSARAARVNRSGIANVATIACPQGTCRVRVPSSVRVRVRGRGYVLRVLAPKTLRAGKRGKVQVRLSRAARRSLAGRRLTVRFALRVTSGTLTATRTVNVKVTVPRATTGRRGGARRR